MAYLTVTTPFDVVAPGDGQLSLREAIAQANATSAADSIGFVLTLEGQTLVLTGGELPINQDLTIDGDRNDDGSEVTIDGNANGRILNISGAGTEVALRNLTLANGYFDVVGSGGAVSVEGAKLVGNNITIRDSHTGIFGGGGISAENGSRLELIDSTLFGNYRLGPQVGR